MAFPAAAAARKSHLPILQPGRPGFCLIQTWRLFRFSLTVIGTATLARVPPMCMGGSQENRYCYRGSKEWPYLPGNPGRQQTWGPRQVIAAWKPQLMPIDGGDGFRRLNCRCWKNLPLYCRKIPWPIFFRRHWANRRVIYSRTCWLKNKNFECWSILRTIWMLRTWPMVLQKSAWAWMIGDTYIGLITLIGVLSIQVTFNGHL